MRPCLLDDSIPFLLQPRGRRRRSSSGVQVQQLQHLDEGSAWPQASPVLLPLISTSSCSSGVARDIFDLDGFVIPTSIRHFTPRSMSETPSLAVPGARFLACTVTGVMSTGQVPPYLDQRIRPSRFPFRPTASLAELFSPFRVQSLEFGFDLLGLRGSAQKGNLGPGQGPVQEPPEHVRGPQILRKIQFFPHFPQQDRAACGKTEYAPEGAKVRPVPPPSSHPTPRGSRGGPRRSSGGCFLSAFFIWLGSVAVAVSGATAFIRRKRLRLP